MNNLIVVAGLMVWTGPAFAASKRNAGPKGLGSQSLFDMLSSQH
jgi:hypothetical protein